MESAPSARDIIANGSHVAEASFLNLVKLGVQN